MEPLNGQRVDANENTVSREYTPEKPNLKGDRLNFYLLILLYIIQGFSIGLYTGLSIIFQSIKGVTFEDQAVFSLVLWPFSMKLLFAPIIDAFNVQWIGRRKFWLIILQSSMGVLTLYLANNIHDWMPTESGKPNFNMIVILVFFIIFFSSIQDIVVDGWSLEMLKKRKIGYSSVSGSIGMILGMLIGTVCFTLLVSEKFKSKFMQTTPGSGGLITMKTFLTFWAILIFMVTTLVGIFKKETRSMENNHEKINVLENYKLLWDILKLPRIRVLSIALLTYATWTVAAGPASHMKLIDGGVPKDDLMIIKLFMYGIKVFVPIFVSKYIASPNSMTYFMKVLPFGLLFYSILTVFVYYTPRLINNKESVNGQMYYYLTLCFLLVICEMVQSFLSSSVTTFFSQISDPRFGGTYLTLLNAFVNFGKELALTFGLKLIGKLTYSKCSNETQNHCNTISLRNVCNNNGGSCNIYLDGYFIIIPMYILSGLIWYCIFQNTLRNYQSLGLSHWIVYKQKLNTEEVIELQ